MNNDGQNNIEAKQPQSVTDAYHLKKQKMKEKAEIFRISQPWFMSEIS